MKKSYFFNSTLRVSLVLFFAISILGFTTSCKDDEEDQFEDVSLQFVVETDKEAMIDHVITQIGTSQNTIFDVINDDSWKSDPQVVNTSVGAIHLAATGVGNLGDSELIVKILINGEVVAENKAVGAGNVTAKTMVEYPVVNNIGN